VWLSIYENNTDESASEEGKDFNSEDIVLIGNGAVDLGFIQVHLFGSTAGDQSDAQQYHVG
jgi:hypothetical protein